MRCEGSTAPLPGVLLEALQALFMVLSSLVVCACFLHALTICAVLLCDCSLQEKKTVEQLLRWAHWTRGVLFASSSNAQAAALA
jgi:hypothetical protein